MNLVNRILDEAKSITGKDRKYDVQLSEFKEIVKAGGETTTISGVDTLNMSQHGGGYLHKVLYKGYRFISVTKDEVDF